MAEYDHFPNRSSSFGIASRIKIHCHSTTTNITFATGESYPSIIPSFAYSIKSCLSCTAKCFSAIGCTGIDRVVE